MEKRESAIRICTNTVDCLLLFSGKNRATEARAGRRISWGEHFYLVGLLSLKKTYPHTLIYPETFAEKLSEIFVKTELDFKNNKKFSRRFYTLTRDKQSLASLLYVKSLDGLSKHTDLELEPKENHCIFRQNRKPVTRKDADAFANYLDLFTMPLTKAFRIEPAIFPGS